MRVKWSSLAAAVLAIGLGSATTWAGAFDPKYVPADAKWVVHVDVDKLAKSQTYDIFMNRAEAESDEKVREKLAKFGEALGTQFPADLHGITLVGRGFDEKSAVLVIKAHMDRDRLMGLAKVVNGFTSTTRGGTEIASLPVYLGGSNESVSGAFVADDVLVIGRTSAEVERMLDLAAGKEKAVASDRLLATNATDTDGSGVMVYIAAEGLAELQRRFPVSPILAQVTAARVSLAERGEDVNLKAVMTLSTPELAKQTKGAIEGLRALVGLAAMDDNGDEDAKAVASLSKRAVVTADGTTVTVDWPVAVTELRTLIDEDAKNEKAKKAEAAAEQHKAEAAAKSLAGQDAKHKPSADAAPDSDK